MPEQLRLVARNLQALGPRRLVTLAGVMLATLALVAAIGLYAARPAFETLYTGLERDDINRIGPVLGQAGIAYDVDAAGGTVLVEAGRGSQARMILAEQGLPRSQGSGYELFDRMGSLGLTSFMQQMTRVRALEGEVARSIRSIQGVRSARVHIMLPDRTSFADRSRRATASVLLGTDRRMNGETAASIRHLVAAAVPQLATDDVSVLDASGRLLASGKTRAEGGTGLAAVEAVETRLAEKIARVLEPRLGPDAFRVAVRATLDMNERRVEETTFDPDSRVERSVRVIKLEETNVERSAERATSVEADLPEATGDTAPGPRSNQASQRREETTNYEINSKKTATVRRGYEIARLSASVVVDRAQLERLAGGRLDAATLQARLDAIRRNVIAAGGFDPARDTVEIETDAFVVADAGAAPGLSLPERLAPQLGTLVRALAMIAAVGLVVLGARPLVRMALADRPVAGPAELAAPADAIAPTMLSAPSGATGETASPVGEGSALSSSTSAAPTSSAALAPTPQERLQALVDGDEKRAADVLRAWLSDDPPPVGEPVAGRTAALREAA